MMIGQERGSQTSKPPQAASPAAPAPSASRRRSSRAGRKHSSGSVQSSSSSGTAEVRQPAKARIRRQQQRLSAVFGRSARPAAGHTSADDDPAELSQHITAPGILKIFGTDICEGANYKSVLATTRSSARELLKEALARYGVSRAQAQAFVLCDVTGRVEAQGWRTECVRAVGDEEKPLLLQALWKPRDGFARRFEIQRRATLEEIHNRERDTETAGINAQARRLQKSRSRVKCVQPDGSGDDTLCLLKSLSETDLTTHSTETHTHTQSPVSEREETESSDDSGTQYSIHPPLHFPYLLLLHGFSHRQDFLVYPLLSVSTVFGREVEMTEADVEGVCLWAPDLLPHHCCVRRLDLNVGRPVSVVLEPLSGAVVRINGDLIRQETELKSGDVIALGHHYVFMFKDPTCPEDPPASQHALCQACVPAHRSRALPRGFIDASGSRLALVYDMDQESSVLKEIFRVAERDGSAHKLTPAFLLCLCLQRSGTHFPIPALRRLLLQTANHIQIIVWEKAKDIAALQPEIRSDSALIRSLEPLVLWMSNSIQILHFIQEDLQQLLNDTSTEDEEQDCEVSSVRSACEEAVAVLEEVLMFTFQQCVYYLTKLLYAALPAVLDSDWFSSESPVDLRRVLDVCEATLQTLQELQLHPAVSAQLFSYLFFFSNALLFNLLMERGSSGSFYSWSCGVRIRANLDLLMDWTDGVGLGRLAHRFLLKVSSAVDLLATPRENLLQMSWRSLRSEFSCLNAAQLHHLLQEYESQRPRPVGWTPCSDEARAALSTDELLESFDGHPPLVLPTLGFPLELKRPIAEIQLIRDLRRLQTRIDSHELVSAVPMEAKRTKMEAHPMARLEVVIPQDLGSCEALLTKKLESLELRSEDVDASCLLTPPNTPLNLELSDSDTDSHVHSSRPEGEEFDDDADEDVFVLELQRAACGLGLMLVDGEGGSGMFIRSILPGSPASESERLRVGDRILAVNGVNLAGVDYQTGVDLIQTSGERPRLLVSRSHCTRDKPESSST